jgi:DNA-directed RNA polymerase subunit M/transcription elongation factor TFIIS
MADPTGKRLLARINGDLEWRSRRFRLGRKTYDLVAMGVLLANIRRRTGYRFKPALVPADPRDSDITDHGESSEEEERVGDEYSDKLTTDHGESSKEEKVGDSVKSTTDHGESSSKEEFVKNETKSLACGACDRRLSSSDNLRRHRKSVHELIRYSCSKCSKRFSRSDNLKRHVGVCIA